MTELAGETRQNFGHYDVESVLGRGAMGMVYLARDRRIGRKVALKTVHVNEKFDDESEANEFYKRLQREAELCGALQHPNIVTLYEPGYENNVIAWLATEYVDGENLRDRMRKRKPLPLDESLHIVEGILRGLAYAHAKNIVHRDIKPANILLTSTGEPKIADFGIARPLDSTLTAVGEMLGTPSYMSPEQVRCQPVTTRSDLFSVGAVLYEMLTGIKAFGASDVTGILRNVVETAPKPAHEVNTAVPVPLSGFLDRLYAKKPEDRFPSAVEALDDLQRIRQEIGPTEAAAASEPSEEVDDAHSTLAVTPRSSEMGTVPPSVTEPDYDMTPALTTRRSVWKRDLPAPLFWAVIFAALAMFTAGVVAIGSKIDSRPTSAYSPAQIRALESKRAALRAARAWVQAGRFEEGIAAYNAYIAKYPNSPAAKDELANAQLALARANESKSKVTVTESKRTSTTETKKEPDKKPSLLHRLFHRGGSKSPAKTPPKQQQQQQKKKP
jgi:serine/threonine protein kinase